MIDSSIGVFLEATYEKKLTWTILSNAKNIVSYTADSHIFPYLVKVFISFFLELVR